MEQATAAKAWIKISKSGHSLEISGGGPWLASTVRLLHAPLRKLSLEDVKSCRIHLEEVSSVDTSGAWLIERLFRALRANAIQYSFSHSNSHLEQILNQIQDFDNSWKPEFSDHKQTLRWIEEVGIASISAFRDSVLLVQFLGELTLALIRCIIQPSRLRPVSIVAILNRTGLNAIPIVGLIAFLIGVVLVYQGSSQLTKFGAEIYTVDLLAVSLLRELGILLTAIMVAGRSGSAFAAQIGTMKLNQEIDALQTFGLNPMEVLVVPRVIALLVALPLLAFITDIIGLAGGAIMSNIVLDISFVQYIQQLQQSLSSTTFWVGMIKAPVFGFIIAMVGCFEGMQVHGGALSVGSKTTKAVVESIFLVVVLDAMFSILFTKLDW